MTTRRTSAANEPISAASIQDARARASASGRGVTDCLDEMLALPPAEFIRRLGHTLRHPVLDMEGLYGLTPVFDTISFHEAVQRNCLLARDGETLVCVLADPFNLPLQIWIEARLSAPVEWCLAHTSDLNAFFAVHEDSLRAIDSALRSTASDTSKEAVIEDLSLVSIAEGTSPVIKLVNSTIYDALKVGASDIHIETTAAGLQVKYRIDGVLCHIVSVPGLDIAEQVISRIKVMAELDIAERRVPQDGRFKLSVKGHEIDYRVSVMPSLVSEDVVIRILDKRTLTDQIQGLRLDLLGFDARTLLEIRQLAAKPYGMLLVTGPTGSGKTTTLYAALSEINHGQDKIITIEDPVEYQLSGVLQIPVNEKKGLNFARGLRSILRHDPDKILVGEIRDPETAQIAIQSALTGHLVFTSVHANNVFDVLGRFLHMGVDTYSFVSALNGILAQRLVRVICPQCATPYQPSEEELTYSALSREETSRMHFCRGKGCGHCRGTGYKGRHAIGEVLRLNDELREMIIARAPIRAIKEAARACGTRFLREAALDLVAAGKSTLEEVNRVTFIA
jgi:general secretion pathway protein E